jgi:hypothetical protein
MSDLKSELGLAPEADFAELRKVKLSALRNERARGLGPPFVKIGKSVFYPIKGLREYMAKQAVVPSRAATLVDGRGKRAANAAA